MQSSGVAHGGAAGRMHDGALRLSHAPSALYFLLPTQTDAFYPVSFHPFFAEPGERTTSLTIDLREFTRTRKDDTGGDEPVYRLFFVSLSPSPMFRHRKLSFRATVMLAQKADWAWCEEHLVELDMYDNPLFCCSVPNPTGTDSAATGVPPPPPAAAAGGCQWRAASHFENGRESGDLTVVLTVSGGMRLSPVADPVWMPSSKLALVRWRVCDVGRSACVMSVGVCVMSVGVCVMSVGVCAMSVGVCVMSVGVCVMLDALRQV